MPEPVAAALLDTSCVIEWPAQLSDLASTVSISAITVAELAYGLHAADPVESARRELRYRELLRQFTPLPYSAEAAHWYGALAHAVRLSGRNPRPRRMDLLLASVAVDLGIALITRNPADFRGLEDHLQIIEA